MTFRYLAGTRLTVPGLLGSNPVIESTRVPRCSACSWPIWIVRYVDVRAGRRRERTDLATLASALASTVAVLAAFLALFAAQHDALSSGQVASVGLLPFAVGGPARYVTVTGLNDNLAPLGRMPCVVSFGNGPNGIVLRSVADDGTVAMWTVDRQMVGLTAAPPCSPVLRKLLWGD